MEQIKGFEKFTEYTITNLKDLKVELEKIRSRGYAVDEQECEMGIRCVSVPIYNYTNKVIAGISLSGNIDKLSEDRQPELLKLLLKASEEISRKLGYDNAEQGNS